MEPESPSPYPQVPATYPYPEPTPSSPYEPLQLRIITCTWIIFLPVALKKNEYICDLMSQLRLASYNPDCRKPCEPSTAVRSKMSTELVHRHARRTRRKPNTKLGMSKPRCHAFTLTFHCVRRGDLLCKCSTGNAAASERKTVRGERLGGGREILLELKTSTLELLRLELHNKIRRGESEPGAAWRIHPHF